VPTFAFLFATTESGADFHNGSGLIGLTDRVEALGGHMQISSPAGRGTTLLADIPLEVA
jgi:signal transduction histidine kinase